MDISFRRDSITATFGALAMVAALLLAASGGALAVPTVDSETTDSSETSDITDGFAVADFNGSATDIGVLRATYDTDNIALEIVDPETSEVVKRISGDSTRFSEYDSTNNGYEITLTQSDFAAVEMGAGESKSVTVRMIGDTTADSPPTASISGTLNNVDDRAVLFIGSNATASGVAETEEEEPGFIQREVFGNTDNTTTATVEASNVDIGGAGTTVDVVYAEDTVSSAFESSASSASSWFGLSSSDISESDRISEHIVTLDDENFGIYSQIAPESVLDASGATYAEYDTVGGYPAHSITLGDAYEGESSADISTTGGEELGMFESITTFGDSGIFSFIPSISSLTGMVGAGLFFFGRPTLG